MSIQYRFQMRRQRAFESARLVTVVLIFCSLVSPTDAFCADALRSDAHNQVDLQQESIIQEGKARFIRTCAYCHGQEGEAGKTRPFKTHTDWNPQDIFDTISNGRVRGGNVMPTWKDSIPPDEIWKIVAYIKSLSASKGTVASQ